MSKIKKKDGVPYWFRASDGQLVVCAWHLQKDGDFDRVTTHRVTDELEEEHDQKASHGVCPECKNKI